MGLAKKILGESSAKMEEVDFEKADLVRIWDMLQKKIEMKPAATQVEMYSSLLSGMMSLAKEMPSGEQKIKNVLKQFKSEL
jgi:hypothetical protein